jgi:hypothetical protein
MIGRRLNLRPNILDRAAYAQKNSVKSSRPGRLSDPQRGRNRHILQSSMARCRFLLAEADVVPEMVGILDVVGSDGQDPRTTAWRTIEVNAET